MASGPDAAEQRRADGTFGDGNSIGESTRFKTGNPGRPKGISLVEALKVSLREAQEQAAEGVDRERRDPTIRELASQWLKMAAAGDQIAMAALDKLADRLDGKAMQRVEHSGPDGGEIKISADNVRSKLAALASSEDDDAAECEGSPGESE